MKKYLTVCLSILLLLSGCASRSKGTSVLTVCEPVYHSDAADYEQISYGEDPYQVYDLYIPDGLELDQPQPVILFIHGGGWSGGDKTAFSEEAKSFRDAGYITANMNYRLFGQEGVSVDTILDDITAAISSISDYTASLSLPASQLALSGYSAGGHLALLYSVVRESPLDVAFIFEKCGPLDFYTESWSTAEDSIYLTYFQTSMEDIARLSPDSYPAAVPAIGLYAAYDSTVGTGHAALFQSWMESANLDYALLMAENSSHALLDDPETLAQYHQLALQWADTYFNN